MIALTAFPPKMFGPAKLAVQVTTCLSSASELSHPKEVTLSTSSAAVDWKSIIIIPLRSKNFCPTGLLKGLSSVSPIRPFFWWWLWCGVQEVENRRGRKIFVVPFNHWSWTINFPRENENVTHGLIKSFPRQVRLPNTVN